MVCGVCAECGVVWVVCGVCVCGVCPVVWCACLHQKSLRTAVGYIFRSKRPRTMSKTILHVPLLAESTLYVRTVGSGSKVSLLSKMARPVLSVYAMN